MTNQFTTTFTKEDFKKFVEVLNTITPYVNDLDIRKGILRQQTLDKTNLVHMDLTSLYANDFCISTLSKKLELFELLSSDDTDIVFQVSGKLCSGTSQKPFTYKWIWASPATLSQRFCEDDEYTKKYVNNTTNDKKLYTLNILDRPDVHKKIKKVCENFNSDTIIFKITEKSIIITIESADKRELACVFREDNTNNLPPFSTTVRNSFIEKLDSKLIKNIIFYDRAAPDKPISIIKAECQIENIPFDIYARARGTV